MISDILFDVGPVNIILLVHFLKELDFSFSANSKYLVDDPTWIDEQKPGCTVDGHGVAEMWEEQLADGMSIWEVSHGSHTICLHCSMAGHVVGGELVILEKKWGNR